MAYEIYLDKVLLPVTPSKIQIDSKNQNKTVNLVNGEEVNVLKSAGLKEISFEVLLPQTYYPFAVYENDFESADYFLDLFANLKESRKPFFLLIVRESPSGDSFFDTNFRVTLEEYKISEDAGKGFDLTVSLNFKEHQPYGTKTVAIEIIPETSIPIADPPKEERPANPPPVPRTHTVGPRDSLWSLAKKYWGNGARWPEIYHANRDKIKNPNLIYDGQVLIIP